jgi:hypothetical protein
MDNQRTGQNTDETILTPANVNSSQFGALFSYPTDYQALAQPLYVPGVTMSDGQVHNVVYVATMGDSVYAFDADSNLGGNSAPCSSNPSCLWSVNFTDSANGITLASIYSDTSTGAVSLPCAGNGAGTVGFFQEGIAGTPVIDTVGGTLYLVAKTLENGTVVHRLHALDITSGAEKFGYTNGVVITASSTYVSPITGRTYTATFNGLHELSRPGLLFLTPNANNTLTNSTVYIAFGSNSCNDDSTGWVLAYNADTLAQTASFNDSPQHGLASIWQTGNGIAADEFGNIFLETAETCSTYSEGGQTVPCYDVNLGGSTYSNSILQLNPVTLAINGYFTPYDVTFLNANDEDLSSTGVLILPDQDGTTPHELVASGKQGFIYVLNRDNMGGNDITCTQKNPTCDNVLQEFPLIADAPPNKVRDLLFSSPAYWNGNVYFTPDGEPIAGYPLLPSGLLGTPVNSAQSYVGAHSASVSANGTTNGILWAISGSSLDAFNATTMKLLYSSSQNKTRDTLPLLGHFATQTVVNGKVYIATADTSSAPTAVCTTPPCPGQLSVYGLLTGPTLYSGGNQSGVVGTTIPIQVQVVNPYTGAGVDNLTVTFSAKSGTFNPTSGISMTNSSGVSGIVATTYTLPTTASVITITASVAGGASVSFAETAVAGAPTKLIIFSGSAQSGQAGSILPKQLEAKVEDVHSNVVPGVTVTFVDKSGLGTLNPTSGISYASGIVATSYQLPTTLGAYKIAASAAGVTAEGTFSETATGDAPASLAVVSGNNQSVAVGMALSQPLVVQINDSGGNPITGVSVVFSAPSGTFTGSPATTNSSGQAAANYTAGKTTGPVSVTATVDKLNTQFSVTVTVGAPATVTITRGNNQAAGPSTTLP